jgi:hypothetical protein
MKRLLRMIKLTTTTDPADSSTNTMAAEAFSLSSPTAERIWRTLGLNPHVVETFAHIQRSRVHTRK